MRLQQRRLWQGLLALLIVFAVLDRAFPLPDPAYNGEGFTQVVTDRHGRVLRAFADQRGVWRYPVTPTQVSPDYLRALLGYEDRWFYYHPGINPVALLRAAYQNVRCDCIVSGGSTITMQVARRLSPHDRTFIGKLRQMLRALQLEWHLSKDEILTLYLNYVPMGGPVEGVAAASQMYLDKSAANLSLAEGALLAVLPQSPSRLRPDRYPQRARAARDKVLKRLFSQGDISQRQLDDALLEPVFAASLKTPLLAPLLARHLATSYPQNALISSTLDQELQRDVEMMLADTIRQYPDQQSAAVLVVDNTTREVLVYAGSADFLSDSRFGHVDMVRAVRSPGSTLKPFIYGMAMDTGLIHSASLLRDVPRHQRSYQPENFARSFTGPVDTTTALRQSLNLPAVQVLEALGPATFAATLTNAGTPYRLPAHSNANLALALGGGGFTLWDLATLYSALSNGGKVQPLQVMSTKDVVSDQWLLSPEASWAVLEMLRRPDPLALRSAALRQHQQSMAWKTGTSYGFRDAWAVGVTPTYTMAVWFGRPDGTPSPGQYGAVTALPFLFRLQSLLDPAPQWPEPPTGVTRKAICWPSGLAADKTPADQCHVVHSAWLIRDMLPPTLRQNRSDGTAPATLTVQLDADGRMISPDCNVTQAAIRQLALWPSELEPWLPPHRRLNGQLPPMHPDCSVPQLGLSPLRIIGIKENQLITPANSGQTSVTVTAGILGGLGDAEWYLNGIPLQSEGTTADITLSQPGPQEVVVLDAQGNVARVIFAFQLRQ